MIDYHDNTQWKYHLQYCYMIPLRGFDIDPDRTFHGLCVLPRSSLSLDPSAVIDDIKGYLAALEKERLYAPDIGAQVKYEKTRLFLHDVQKAVEQTTSLTVYQEANKA